MTYDIIVIGAGPAGMTAALYGMRAGFHILLLEKAFPGGQMVFSDRIENYPGFSVISGSELAQNMKNRLTDITYKAAEVTSLDLSEKIKTVHSKKEDFFAKNVVIASGAAPKKLRLVKEERLTGRGVSYCATCDGALYRGKTATVIGGGNTALEDALYLANFCDHVNLVHRRKEFRGDQITAEKVIRHPKIQRYLEYVPQELIGTDRLEQVICRHTVTGEMLPLVTDGLFVAIGYQPNISFLPSAVLTDEIGEIITDQNLMTNLEDVYAIGDVRKKALRQIITACSDGAEVITAIQRKAAL